MAERPNRSALMVRSCRCGGKRKAGGFVGRPPFALNPACSLVGYGAIFTTGLLQADWPEAVTAATRNQ